MKLCILIESDDENSNYEEEGEDMFDVLNEEESDMENVEWDEGNEGSI